MKIAVVGSGVSGLVAARLLARAHDVTLFERDARVGGHVHTHRVERPSGVHSVDTGFIVFNERTYPLFTRLLAELGVPSRESSMSFSVRCERTGLEYDGTSLDTLFAQRRNLLRPSFLRMLRDVVRFHREARALLGEGPETTFGDWLARGRWSREFREHYLEPMCAAIWSAGVGDVAGFPARSFARFFENHGMLQVDDRPVWRTVEGGSATYVRRIVADLGGRVRANCPVAQVRRTADGVEVRTRDGGPESFDHVVLAVHSDQALALLADPGDAEREVLSAIPYRANDAALHTDGRMLPRTRRARAAWNFHLLRDPSPDPTVTYDMVRLQGLRSPEPLLVTLNRTADLDPGSILARTTYHHPVYTERAPAAQARWDEVNGVRRTWYCGAWWGWGFHEDGVRSAVAVTKRFGIEP